MLGGRGTRRAGWLVAAACATGALTAAPAAAATEQLGVTASDGVRLQATLTSDGPVAPRPTIVEFSPYGRSNVTYERPPGFNGLLVQLRGTGDSDGRFDIMAARTQRDVVEVLRWACEQPWSAGRIGINGFSASAITIYNALHQKLPDCVRTIVLGSGTHELYRDLLVPGGVNNIVPGAAVLAGIGGIAVAQGTDRLARNPGSALDVLGGLLTSGVGDLLHPTLDAWWRERGWRGNANRLPMLLTDGFFDVESRGAFQGFQALKADGAHLVVAGAHDGVPKGLGLRDETMRRWFEHYVAGVDNGVDREPRVRLALADGDRQRYLAGRYVRRDAEDWPVPGTRWQALRLDAAHRGRGASANDGALTTGTPRIGGRQSYVTLPSLLTATDVPNAAIAGAAGLDRLTEHVPLLSQTNLAGALGLTYTTRWLREDVVVAGPATLEVRLASTLPETAIWAVVSDVWPDGSAHPVGMGRLSTRYPEVDPERSLRDADGTIVQPYGRYDRPVDTPPGTERTYRVELWPIGNVFRRGHQLRLHLVGSSLASLPSLPAVNTVDVARSRLLVPVLPPGDLGRALPD